MIGLRVSLMSARFQVVDGGLAVMPAMFAAEFSAPRGFAVIPEEL
jgi:hypothetical protein